MTVSRAALGVGDERRKCASMVSSHDFNSHKLLFQHEVSSCVCVCVVVLASTCSLLLLPVTPRFVSARLLGGTLAAVAGLNEYKVL